MPLNHAASCLRGHRASAAMARKITNCPRHARTKLEPRLRHEPGCPGVPCDCLPDLIAMICPKCEGATP